MIKKNDWKNENQNWIRKKLNEIKYRWKKKDKSRK
jgi:hypothetical protein